MNTQNYLAASDLAYEIRRETAFSDGLNITQGAGPSEKAVSLWILAL